LRTIWQAYCEKFAHFAYSYSVPSGGNAGDWISVFDIVEYWRSIAIAFSFYKLRDAPRLLFDAFGLGCYFGACAKFVTLIGVGFGPAANRRHEREKGTNVDKKIAALLGTPRTPNP